MNPFVRGVGASRWLACQLKSYRKPIDNVNRLTGYNEVTLGYPGEPARIQNYAYDGFGNGWRTSQVYVPTGSIVPAGAGWFNLGGITNNRMSGVSYDLAGNQTQMTPYTVEYDGENRQKKVKQGTAEVGSYDYDGNGRRVKRTVGGATTYYVYDAQGELMAEYGGTVAGGTRYVVGDRLGSTRLVADGAGNCVGRTDYLPFGMEMPRPTEACYGALGVAQKFTGKERDEETVNSANPSGLDFFEARYLASAQGRFMSPDPGNAGGKVPDPQSWNMYSYGRNNPLKYVDPDGLAYRVCDSDGKNCADISDQEFYNFQQQNKNLFTFTGKGEILNNGNLTGTFQQTSVDLAGC